jgi:hypothetical protein
MKEGDLHWLFLFVGKSLKRIAHDTNDRESVRVGFRLAASTGAPQKQRTGCATAVMVGIT